VQLTPVAGALANFDGIGVHQCEKRVGHFAGRNVFGKVVKTSKPETSVFGYLVAEPAPPRVEALRH
jgi:hypothetical protein